MVVKGNWLAWCDVCLIVRLRLLAWSRCRALADSRLSGHAEISELIKCVSVPDIGSTITHSQRLAWGHDRYRVQVTNNESYPVKIFVSPLGNTFVNQQATYKPPGDDNPHELQPGGTWDQRYDHKCAGSPLVLGVRVQIIESNGRSIPGSFEQLPFNATFDDCLNLKLGDLDLTVQHEKSDRPSEARIVLQVTNNGSDVLVVKATEWEVQRGSVHKPTEQSKMVEVPAGESKLVAAAELRCSTDGLAQVRGGINIHSVNGRLVPSPGSSDFFFAPSEWESVTCAAPLPCTQFIAEFSPRTKELEVYSLGLRFDHQFPFLPRFREHNVQRVTVDRDQTEGNCRSPDIGGGLVDVYEGIDSTPV